jgi:hypothetical protein
VARSALDSFGSIKNRERENSGKQRKTGDRQNLKLDTTHPLPIE